MRPALKRSRSLWDGLKTVPDETDLLRQMGNSFLTKTQPKLVAIRKSNRFWLLFLFYVVYLLLR